MLGPAAGQHSGRLQKQCSSVIRTQEGRSDWFEITSGVRQGCVLSPLLLIMYVGSIAQETGPNPDTLNQLFLVDDQALAHEQEEQLEEHTANLNVNNR